MANSTLLGSKRSHSAKVRVAGLSFSFRSHNSWEKRRMESLKSFSEPLPACRTADQYQSGETASLGQIAGGDQRKVLGPFRVRRDGLIPKAQQDGIDN